MKNFLIFILCFAALSVRAAVPTFNDFNPNQFASNVFKVTVKGGALMTNTTFRPASPGAGAFGTPNFKFAEGTDTFTLQDLGPTPIWTFDSAGETYTFFFPIHGDGSGLTNLPSTTGILTLNGLGTNTTFRGTVTNFATTANGAGGSYFKLMPTWHSNSTYAAPWNHYQLWTYQTDFNHDHPDVVTTFGYNLAPGGIVNANEPALGYIFESRWQNFDNFEQSEWYLYYATPTNGYGTNYAIRFLSFTPQYKIGTDNQTFTSADLSVESSTFSVKTPNWGGTSPFVVNTTPNVESASLYLAGYLVARTNTLNYGGVSLLGGEIDWRVPTGFAGSSVSGRIDYDNAIGFRPDFYLLSQGTAKSFITSGFTNLTINRDNVMIHGVSSRIQATNAHFANITNTSTTAAIVWANSEGKQGEVTIGSGLSLSAGGELTATGGSGDTNAISYLPDLVNAAKTRNLANGVPVFDVARWTNGVNAISITNTGTDTDSFGIKDSTGGDRFRFTSGISLMTVNSGGPFQLHVDETTIVEDYQTGIRRLHDANGDLAIDFSDAADVQMTTLAPTTVNASTVNLLEGGKIALDAALSADGTYSATVTRAGTAGATLAFGDLIVLDPTDSRWELADANSASGADGDARGMIGICILAAAADGDPTVVLLQGVVRADAVFPSFTVNAPIYVSETAGDITGTSPTTEDNVVRILGAATTADEIYFAPDRVWTVYDAP